MHQSYLKPFLNNYNASYSITKLTKILYFSTQKSINLSGFPTARDYLKEADAIAGEMHCWPGQLSFPGFHQRDTF